jgi:hypothetical protein
MFVLHRSGRLALKMWGIYGMVLVRGGRGKAGGEEARVDDGEEEGGGE